METLIDYCSGGRQEMVQSLVQDVGQDGMQAEAQGMAQNPEQETAQEPVQPEAQADTRDLKQGMKQEPAQAPEPAGDRTDVQDANNPASEETPQGQMRVEAQDAATSRVPVRVARVSVNLPGIKEKPALITVSMRLVPEVKAQLQAMAKMRRMSLGEFCAAVMGDVAAQAGDVAGKTEAA